MLTFCCVPFYSCKVFKAYRGCVECSIMIEMLMSGAVGKLCIYLKEFVYIIKILITLFTLFVDDWNIINMLNDIWFVVLYTRILQG